jgi:hypothetical protein
MQCRSPRHKNSIPRRYGCAVEIALSIPNQTGERRCPVSTSGESVKDSLGLCPRRLSASDEHSN